MLVLNVSSSRNVHDPDGDSSGFSGGRYTTMMFPTYPGPTSGYASAIPRLESGVRPSYPLYHAPEWMRRQVYLNGSHPYTPRVAQKKALMVCLVMSNFNR